MPEARELIASLPATRGKMRAGADLSKSNWFQVGGPAEVLFKPEDTEDLAFFIANKPADLPITVLGVGSNLLVRDGGIDGVVIKLGRGFVDCRVEDDRIIAGSGCLNSSVTTLARDHGIGGLEFLSGIPGGIGGALAMNAGAYGTETKDILVEATAVDPQGKIHTLTPQEIAYSYRHCGLPEGWIFTGAVFQGRAESPEIIAKRMEEIALQRNSTQPVRSRTGGSTFRNPEGFKAWKLIDEAGCRGLRVGGAQMSELHCNFMINTGDATAQDLETLGETVIKRVLEHSGISLHWEIRIIGNSTTSLARTGIAAA
ncbi:MAG TPA: UDP-N-acetylmuramate dehydrogenase [Rickettsiales bacterium]|nr:UDP-N-acetylmuramate dehydrogenase [Rickettsiales bacterium]